MPAGSPLPADLPVAPGEEDRLVAAVDVIGRCGARGLQLLDLDADESVTRIDPTAARTRWIASARFPDGRTLSAASGSPVRSAEGLAASLLHGGICRHCGTLVSLDGCTDPGVLVIVYRRGCLPAGCRYRREGPRWVPGCEEARRDDCPATRPSPPPP